MNILKKTLALGFGFSSLTQEQVNKLIKELMKKQGITEKKARRLANDLIDSSIKTQKRVNSLVTKQAYSLLNKAGVATKKDLVGLEKKLTKKRKTRKKTSRKKVTKRTVTKRKKK